MSDKEYTYAGEVLFRMSGTWWTISQEKDVVIVRVARNAPATQDLVMNALSNFLIGREDYSVVMFNVVDQL